MKDERGIYYYPFPQNKKVRMYVRESDGTICFRLWNSDDPELWSQHGWLPYEAVQQASAMYEQKNDFNPKQAYDLEIARAALKDHPETTRSNHNTG
ncbi:MAG: hypothetical protein K9M96_06425 [Deltaproteobacteria bacterium]|nr:hypothetical protein [Deltaproteobacteria bacterium]MCF8119940.1 hypothetical protein [Deltaproteobacteria bacterium]